MRPEPRRLDATGVIAWLILGGIVVWIGVGVVLGTIDLVRATLDDPLLVAGCIAVAVVIYLVLSAVVRGAGRAWARHRREVAFVAPDRNTRPELLRMRPEPGNARRLLAGLTPLDGAAALAALRRLSARPYLLDGLFHHARRGNLTEQLRPFTEAAALPDASPLAFALASIDRNGYVRQEAVLAMGRHPVPEFVPFLVERAVDVVAPVREAALPVLRALAGAEPQACREPLLRAGARIERREHAAPVLALIAAATEPER
jgi:hypothetical protein